MDIATLLTLYPNMTQEQAEDYLAVHAAGDVLRTALQRVLPLQRPMFSQQLDEMLHRIRLAYGTPS